jgi:hypothetical protein
MLGSNSYSERQLPAGQKTILFRQAVSWWTATHPPQTGQCTPGQQHILFSKDSVLLASNSSSLVRTVFWWMLNLVSEMSVLVDRTHSLQSGQLTGGQQLIIFTQESVLLAGLSSPLLRTQTWWKTTNSLLPGQCLLDRNSFSSERTFPWWTAYLAIQKDSDLVDSKLSSTVRLVTWWSSYQPLQSVHYFVGS